MFGTCTAFFKTVHTSQHKKMSALMLSATQINMICAICRDVYRAPRFLPCYHSFCLACLEELTNRHGNFIMCPTCRALAVIPPGGVRALQVNFYFTEEALEQVRSEGSHSMCPVHTKECVIFHCTQCEKAICIRCKLTKHEGHVTEDLSEASARCKKIIEKEGKRLEEFIKKFSDQIEILKKNKNHVREKRHGISCQIQGLYDDIVAAAQKYRVQAMGQLDVISDVLEQDLAVDTQRVQDKLNFLLQLQSRAQRALSSACDTEVLQVEKHLTRGEGSAVQLQKLEYRLPKTSCRPGLHRDIANDIEDCIRRYIGSPVKLNFATKGNINTVRVGQCGDRECSEVHSLQQKDDESFEVYYGGKGAVFWSEEMVSFTTNRSTDHFETKPEARQEESEMKFWLKL